MVKNLPFIFFCVILFVTMIRCRHFGDCGGCRFQDQEYAVQLAQKQKAIEALFPVAVQSIVPCVSPWQYRNKMEYTFSMDKKGERYLGLIRRSSRGRVVNLAECWLVNSWFQEALNTVRNWWQERGLMAYHPYKDTGSLRTLTLREGMFTGDRMAILTVSGRSEWAVKKEDLSTLIEALNRAVGDKPLSIYLKIHQAIKGKPTEFFEMHLAGPTFIREHLDVLRPLSFHISPSAFFQPNSQQAEKIYRLAAEMLVLPSDAVIWDLYCGTGTLAIALAPLAAQVIGVEISPESALDARENVKRNKVKNVTIVTGDVGATLEKGNYPHPDAIVLDPPRAGLDKKAIEYVVAAKPSKILYIACNPTTQADNIKDFLAVGYTIRQVQPVDQFPHTPHIENIVLLEYDSLSKI